MTRLLHSDVRRLAAGRNDFTAYAFNRDNVRSDFASAHTTPAVCFHPRLAYVLAIGVEQYTDPALRSLRFAATDAEAFAAAIGPDMHSIPKPVVLRNQDATRENVLRRAGLYFASRPNGCLSAAARLTTRPVIDPFRRRGPSLASRWVPPLFTPDRTFCISVKRGNRLARSKSAIQGLSAPPSYDNLTLLRAICRREVMAALT